jgi:hypothetical protein
MNELDTVVDVGVAYERWRQELDTGVEPGAGHMG